MVLFFILSVYMWPCLCWQGLRSCLRFTSSPICFNMAATRTSSLRWNSRIRNPPPGRPQRTACEMYQALCICVQSLLRWTQGWKRHEADPSPRPTSGGSRFSSVSITLLLFDLHRGAKMRWGGRIPSLENSNKVTWVWRDGAAATGHIQMEEVVGFDISLLLVE